MPPPTPSSSSCSPLSLSLSLSVLCCSNGSARPVLLAPPRAASSSSSSPFLDARSATATSRKNRLPLQTSCSTARNSHRKRLQFQCRSAEKRETVDASPSTSTNPNAEPSLLVKLAWYATEAFGNAVSALRPKEGAAASEEEQHEDRGGPVAREVAVQAIRRDFETSYFVTGDMSMNIYELDCEFVDPFVSFKGLKRFKTNVSNLGSFMEESNLKVLDWQEDEDKIYARWRFNCVLALPWRPILAATGSTQYYFNKLSGKIYRHVEMWDISPVDGLRQLVKPNPKVQKTQKPD
ncbi:hypothetical protein O6H91_01G146000 [Diphasiastrum complanatum]|uniref:Uncharacterized protein n=1 Tax=Diphasiastrum complanatum TaxID=34168 RepID=A0ACC2EWY1_DIPCM|nr:hypothetical protein O6H91_01G146000 [Diphasiastrum complanatum]